VEDLCTREPSPVMLFPFGRVQNMIGDILKYLREKEYVSGEVLAQKLGISRVAVWKQIQKLKDIEYKIISDQNLGYCLISRPDLFNPSRSSKRFIHKLYRQKNILFSRIKIYQYNC